MTNTLKKFARILANTHNVQIRTVQHNFKTYKSYRILQFSDFHIKNFDVEHIDYIVKLINMQDVDFVVFTGDIVCNKHTELSAEVLNSLSKIRHTVYAILGNHDYDLYTRSTRREKVTSYRKILTKLVNIGWIYLINENTTYEELLLVGTDDFGHDKWSLNRGCIKKAMKGAEDGLTKIVLTHNPSYADDVIEYCNPDLVLCGHTHAGQIGWSFKILGKKFEWSLASSQKYWKGLYKNAESSIYVNPGIGYDMLAWRTFYPELTIHQIN